MPDSPQVIEFWSRFLSSRPAEVAENARYYEAFAFGGTAESADHLSNLVRRGIKTATSESLRVFQESGQRPPMAGDLSIVLDGAGNPVCVIETIEAVVRPLNEVDAAFAFDYGEGDRTLDWWQRELWEYYRDDHTHRGWTINPSVPIVCERFRVIYDPVEAEVTDEP